MLPGQTLEPEHNGKYLLLDVETGEYEMDADQVVAMQRARAKHQDSLFYFLRVAYRACGHMRVRRLSHRATETVASPPA